jgi:hypothetical protein
VRFERFPEAVHAMITGRIGLPEAREPVPPPSGLKTVVSMT